MMFDFLSFRRQDKSRMFGMTAPFKNEKTTVHSNLSLHCFHRLQPEKLCNNV